MLTALTVDRLIRWFAWAALAVAVLFLLFATRSCHDAKKVGQLEQAVKVSEAVVQAGQNAVETVNDRSETESKIDATVSTGQQQVTNAKSTDEVYDAVRAAMCDRMRANGRVDPACSVR